MLLFCSNLLFLSVPPRRVSCLMLATLSGWVLVQTPVTRFMLLQRCQRLQQSSSLLLEARFDKGLEYMRPTSLSTMCVCIAFISDEHGSYCGLVAVVLLRRDQWGPSRCQRFNGTANSRRLRKCCWRVLQCWYKEIHPTGTVATCQRRIHANTYSVTLLCRFIRTSRPQQTRSLTEVFRQWFCIAQHHGRTRCGVPPCYAWLCWNGSKQRDSVS